MCPNFRGILATIVAILAVSCTDSSDRGAARSAQEPKAKRGLDQTQEAALINWVQQSHIESVSPQLTDSASNRFKEGLQNTTSGSNVERRFIISTLMRTLTVQEGIQLCLSNIKGPFEVLGWRARSVGKNTFVVTFMYSKDGRVRGWAFEVMPAAKIVRDIESDKELSEYYESFPFFDSL